MDGGNKKRKMEEEGDRDEEEKMEQFFALIKSTREVRERIAVVGSREKSAGDKSARTWNPTFKLEDFMEAPAEKPEDADPYSRVGGKPQSEYADEKASTCRGSSKMSQAMVDWGVSLFIDGLSGYVSGWHLHKLFERGSVVLDAFVVQKSRVHNNCPYGFTHFGLCSEANK